METFLKKIYFEDHVIELNNEIKRNLILTGKNGAGKTKLLNSIKQQLIHIENSKTDRQYDDINFGDNFTLQEYWRIKNLENERRSHSRRKKYYKNNTQLFFNNLEDMYGLRTRLNNGFILAFFDSKRLQINQNSDILSQNFKARYSIQDIASSKFIQYLINLRASRAFAFEEGNHSTFEKIDLWFHNLECSFKDLFETENLRLVFDKNKFTFYLIINGKKNDFHKLSDGFSSILLIISEIIMRMRNKTRLKEEGIVIIDEVENHLHVSLQKKILRFLTGFFPNIQFIVSTHSPFVISSIENAVVYDMENKTSSVDLSKYSYESLVEDYFSVDQYSDLIKAKFNEYKNFVHNEEKLTLEEKTHLENLSTFFSNISNQFAPELKAEYLSYELKRWNK